MWGVTTVRMNLVYYVYCIPHPSSSIRSLHSRRSWRGAWTREAGNTYRGCVAVQLWTLPHVYPSYPGVSEHARAEPADADVAPRHLPAPGLRGSGLPSPACRCRSSLGWAGRACHEFFPLGFCGDGCARAFASPAPPPHARAGWAAVCHSRWLHPVSACELRDVTRLGTWHPATPPPLASRGGGAGGCRRFGRVAVEGKLMLRRSRAVSLDLFCHCSRDKTALSERHVGGLISNDGE